MKRAGVPDGVFNVVQGDKVAVDRLLEHPDVKAISFVGSTPVAKAIYETATARGKRVQALGGAKNHMLVLPDADIAMTADAAVSAAGSAGERCSGPGDRRRGIGGRSTDRRDSRAHGQDQVGPGLEAGNEMGPLITREHRDRVTSYVAGAAAEGATVTVDGRDDAACKRDGFFLGTSLLDHVQPNMAIYKDEIFGPVLSMTRVATYDEAIRLVNTNPYANGVALFTNDGGAARKFQHEVEVGMVGINVPIPVPMAYYSFGGWKASLFGDHHIYGRDGVHFYTRTKAITSRWPDPSHRGVDLGFPQNR
jgi:malonate-semialdehyde dehydrogenase (acetylating)/methylmalonate-semialdehyde dehydrogenase